MLVFQTSLYDSDSVQATTLCLCGHHFLNLTLSPAEKSSRRWGMPSLMLMSGYCSLFWDLILPAYGSISEVTMVPGSEISPQLFKEPKGGLLVWERTAAFPKGLYQSSSGNINNSTVIGFCSIFGKFGSSLQSKLVLSLFSSFFCSSPVIIKLQSHISKALGEKNGLGIKSF